MQDDRAFSRPNRGSRMQLLIGEAIEAAQQGTDVAPIRGSDTQIGEMEGEAITYNDYFNESSDAGSYIQSEEESDYVDSDFMTDDDDDDGDDDEGEAEIKDQEKAERRKAKKGAYVDPAKRANRVARTADDDDMSDGSDAPRRAPKSAKKEAKTPGEAGSRSFRSSTKQRSEISKVSATEAAKLRSEQAQKRPQQEERRYTQEELLEEAKMTAIENEKDLRRLVKIEDDMKRVVWNKAALTGPRIQFRSNKSGNIVTWSEPDTMPSSFGGSPPAVVKKSVCVITGQPARYLDPVTGHPYATLDAFKKIRAQAGIA